MTAHSVGERDRRIIASWGVTEGGGIRWWAAGDARRSESSSSGWRVGVDGESHLVDDHVVVEPAQQSEVLRVVGAAQPAFSDVVRF